MAVLIGSFILAEIGVLGLLLQISEPPAWIAYTIGLMALPAIAGLYWVVGRIVEDPWRD